MGRLAGASLAEPSSLCPVMSEAGMETLEDEWQSISEIASTCNTILESLSREGEATEGECCGEEQDGALTSFTNRLFLFPHRTAHPRERRCQGNPKI